MIEDGVTQEIERRISQIRRYMGEDIKHRIYSGACVTMLDNRGKPHFVEEGTRTYQDPKPFTRESYVDIASITKLLTALAFQRIFQSGDQGKGLQDTQISDFFPHIQYVDGKPITVADLLCMRAEWKTRDSLSDISRRIGETTSDIDEKRNLLRSAILSSPIEKLGPTGHNYQDASYMALGWILEAYYKQMGRTLTYEEIIRELVLEPLDMHHTTLRPPVHETVPSGVRDGKLIQGVPHDLKALLIPGHAGFFSTAQDLAQLARMLQHSGASVRGGNRFLTPDSFASLIRPQTLDPRRGWWGMGIRRFTPDVEVVSHWYGQHADQHTLCSNGFTGQHLVVYGQRASGIFLNNYHVPIDINREAGDRTFAEIQSPRKRILTEISQHH